MSYVSQVRIGDNTYDIRNDKVKQEEVISTDGEYPVLLGYDTSTITVINSVNKTSTLKYNPSTGRLDSTKFYGTYLNSLIPFATVDSMSTKTVFTATVPEITELRDGISVYLFNNVITSASGCTLNVNGLGAKPIYLSVNEATRVTTQWGKNTSYIFIYNSTRVSGGCWDFYQGYNTNSDTIAYQLRYNNSTVKAEDTIYRYMIMLQSSVDQVIPINTTSNSTATTKTLTTKKFLPFGAIGYYNTTTTIAVGSAVPGGNFWYAFNNIDLRYSFNCGSTLTAQKDVYIRCIPQSDGYFVLDGNDCIVQDLPMSKDGKTYLMLGRAASTYQIDLYPVHPSYYYDEGLHLWTSECYVRQNEVISDNADYPVLLGYDTSTATVTNAVNKTSTLKYNPSTGTLSATKFSGDGSSLTSVTADTATTATYLSSVSLTGDVTGSGSNTNSITTTLANSGVTAGSYGSSSGATLTYGDTFTVPYITVDAKGRATDVSNKTFTLPASDNTDEKVKQNSAITTNGEYPVLLAYSTATNSTVTNSVNKTSTLIYNPSTGTLSATKFVGDGSSLTGISTDDKYVEQEAVITNDADYPVLLGYDTSTVTVTNVVNKSADLTYNPSTGLLSAPQVSFDNYTADVVSGSTEPYVFRQTENGDLDSDKTGSDLKKIIGASFAWNQLIKNGNFVDTNGWNKNRCTLTVANNIGTFTCNDTTYSLWGTYRAITGVIVGHKCLMKCQARVHATNTPSKIQISGVSTSISNVVGKDIITSPSNDTWYNLWFIGIVNDTTNFRVQINEHQSSAANVTVGDTFSVKNVIFTDLTQDFGSTIADYIYTLESTNEGDGLAWFEKYFSKAYYANTDGTFESVNTAKYIANGFNQWNEKWEVGGLNSTTGADSGEVDRIRSIDYIRILPDTVYYVLAGEAGQTAWQTAICFYDGNKNFINRIYKRNIAFRTPVDAVYMRFMTTGAYGPVYNNDLCFNISSSRNGEYEPYVEYVTDFDTSVKLLGIPSLNANNELAYEDGDIYEPNKVTRKYSIIDLGSEEIVWTKASNTNVFFTTSLSGANKASKMLCTKYQYGGVFSSNSGAYNAGDKTVSVYNGTDRRIYVRDDSLWSGTTDEFSTAMSGVYLIYPLESPIIEYVTPYTEYSKVSYEGTQQFVDNGVLTGTRDIEIPVAPDMSYSTYINYALNGSAMSGSSGGGSADNSYYTVDITGLTQTFQNSNITIYTGTPSTNLTSVYNALINDKKRCKATVTLSEFSNNTVDVMLDGAIANVGVSGTMTYTDSTDLSTHPTAKEISVQINSTGAIVYVRTIWLYRVPYDGTYVLGDYNGSIQIS